MELGALATHIAAELVGDPRTRIDGVAPIAAAAPGTLTFLVSADYEAHLATTKASAVIVASRRPDLEIAQLVHKNPYWAFAKVSQLFFQRPRPAAGVAEEAFVAPDATVDPTATVMPFAYVGPKARIGRQVVLYPGVFVGEGCVVGDGSELRANVVLEYGVQVGARVLIHANTTIGADGFGFAPGEGELAKIPQIGAVSIADDVEIGGCATVDRGALEDTKIGRGTKLDSGVHVGHGTTIGEHSMMCGLAGIAGSARIGNWVVLAGHSAVNSKVELKDGTQIGAMTAVTSSPGDKDTYIGFPAIPAREWRRQAVTLRKLPELEKRLRALEAKLGSVT
jgi:UDP-3-O-[3-hydroxymyristoyl] glucosamine N-acyltransferase